MKRRIANQLRRIARRLDPPQGVPSYSMSILNVVDAERCLADARRQMTAAYQGRP